MTLEQATQTHRLRGGPPDVCVVHDGFGRVMSYEPSISECAPLVWRLGSGGDALGDQRTCDGWTTPSVQLTAEGR